MNDKLKPILLSGLAIGLLSTLPLLSLVNVVCCAWAVGGGILAVRLYWRDVPTQSLSMGTGIMLGGLAGLVGGLIYALVSVVLLLFTDAAQQSQELLRQFGMQQDIGKAALIVGLVISVLVMALMAGVGGVLGVKLFEKGNATQHNSLPPVPPPDFSR